MGEFKLISDYQPGGDQPRVIEQLAQDLNSGQRVQTFLESRPNANQ